jgi:hypothetical protein
MKDILKKFGFALALLLTACNLDGDLTDPNQISVSGADVDLLMNQVQLDFAAFFNNRNSQGVELGTSTVVSRLMRHSAMTAGDRYQTAIQPQTVDFIWQRAYRRVLVNAETLIPLAQEKNFTTHVAVAKILQAYVYFTLVDVFGDVPQTEALKGVDGNFNPKADPGSEVYAKGIALLGEAKIELAKTGTAAGGGLSRDIYYGGNRVKWNALANTLEMKAWLNISMIPSRQAEANAKIDVLLTTDLVDTEAENFTYKYGTATVPSSRHPSYNQYYDPIIGSAAGYIGNHFMWELYQGNGVQDPRWRYYLYRQVGSNAHAFTIDPKNVGCGEIPDAYASGNFVFCQFEPGFYGRDHGDDSGVNPDSPFITCLGAYPAGGKIDAKPTTNRTFHEPTIQGDGGNGAGIEPIFMSFFTDFMKAEYALRKSNDVAGAKTLLATAIANSIAQIRNFSNSRGQTLPAGLEPSTSAYQSAVATKYDAATNKMDIVGREFYMASFGNGIEAYNLYRRTGAPRGLQPTRIPNPGTFFRSLVYPAEFVNLNSHPTAVQKNTDVSNKVFWDTNPEDLK